MSYETIDHPASVGGRIPFRYHKSDDNSDDYITPARLAAQGIALAYIGPSPISGAEALNSLGRQLKTDNAPYDPHPPAGMKGWYRFMDDLITLGDREAGMVIIVDHAGWLFADPASWVYELITIWVHQLKRWQLRGAPCHLVFQMDQDPAVASIYGAARKSR